MNVFGNKAVFCMVLLCNVLPASQRSILASAGGGAGGARSSGSSSGGSRSSISSPSRASTSTSVKTVSAASQSRYSSGLAKYKGPVGLTNLAPGSRVVFVPTGNNYFIWFLLVNGELEEIGEETDDVHIDPQNLPPGCVTSDQTGSMNGTASYNVRYLEQTHTYRIDDIDITCGPVDITTADEDKPSLSSGAIFGIVVGGFVGLVLIVAVCFYRFCR